jgi:hypothetical protein
VAAFGARPNRRPLAVRGDGIHDVCFATDGGKRCPIILGMYRRICVLLTALVLPLAGAGDAPLDRATLRGVTAVSVVIDPVAPEIEKEGVTIDALRMRLEEGLRNADIQMDTASTSFLALRLRSVRAARGPLAIAITIGLYQPVTLVRDATIKTATATWEVDSVILADQKQVYRACIDLADELTGRFVTAYKSVNASKSK